MAIQPHRNVYPTLPSGLETRLSAVVFAARGSRGYFDDPECPYGEDLKGLLRLLLGSGKAERVKVESVGLDDNADKFDKMLKEIEETIEEMKSIEDDLTSGEVAERIQFVKAKTILLEKWIGIKEKIYNVREIAEFQAILIRQLDGVMSKDQRFSFIGALRALRTTVKAADELEDSEMKEQN